MYARWLMTCFIALCIAFPPAVPSFVREVQQVEWCIVLDMERNAWRRMFDELVEDDL